MDETREMTAETVERPLSSSVEIDDLRDGLDVVARVIDECVTSALGISFAECASASLEAMIESFGFERGFFLLEGGVAVATATSGASDRDEDPAESGSFRVVASRSVVRDDAGSHWKDVNNSEYAFDRSAVSAVVAMSSVVAKDGYLGRSSIQDGDRYRPILCRAVRLTTKQRAVIYLEDELSLDSSGVGETQREAFAQLVERLASIWGRAYLEVEAREREAQAVRGELSPPSHAPMPVTDVPSGEDVDDPDGLPAASHDAPESFHGIIGEDEKLGKVFQIINKVKDSDLNVCIFGESGTGKELVARAIHEASNRSESEFVSENCGAISETLLESELFGHVKGAFTGADEDRKGLFELADKGTLFLDEIGDMSESMQRKLLRALQEGVIRPIGSKESIRVDVRVICASNRDLKHLVQKNEFRADLYYRLNVITIQVPPLRDRRGDVPLLISHFAREVEEQEWIKKRLSESAMKALVQYGWPGNVRELRNVVRRLLLTSERRVIARKDVTPFLVGGAQGTACLGENLERDDDSLILRIPMRTIFNDIIDECEKLVLQNALKENGWNKSRVTKALGISRQSLYNKISKYKLSKPGAEDAAE